MYTNDFWHGFLLKIRFNMFITTVTIIFFICLASAFGAIIYGILNTHGVKHGLIVLSSFLIFCLTLICGAILAGEGDKIKHNRFDNIGKHTPSDKGTYFND